MTPFFYWDWNVIFSYCSSAALGNTILIALAATCPKKTLLRAFLLGIAAEFCFFTIVGAFFSLAELALIAGEAGHA